MRKFLPRLINLIAFIIALIAFIPDAILLVVAQKLDTIFKTSGVFYNLLSNLFNRGGYYSYKIIYIPIIFLSLSIIYLIAAQIDKKIKSHNNEASPIIELNTYYPLLFFGIISSLQGIIYTIFQILNKNYSCFKIEVTDYFYLGNIIVSKLGEGKTTFNSFIGLLFFLILFVFEIILYLKAFKKNYKKPFIIRFLSWLLTALLSFLSIKGYYYFNNFSTKIGFKKLFLFSINENTLSFPFDAQLIKVIGYTFLYAALILLVIFLIIGIRRIIKNNKLIKTIETNNASTQEEDNLFKPVNGVPSFDDLTKDIKELDSEEIKEKENTIPDTVYNTKEPQEIIETIVEEKTIIKQVIFEDSNLDKIFAYNFNFNNVQMVINSNGSQDYYVNKIKFLTLSNNNRTMSFRLELDKAIKLIIQYPLISKDKYEDHKIWFRIDDNTKLSNDVLIMVIKDAYNAILNDD